MKRVLLLLFNSLVIVSQAADLKKIKLHDPIIPNNVKDKYIPAYYENIEGLLGYRMNINLEKRLLQIDSAILLSGFRKRPGSQTWIGEHVGKFLFSASNTYKYTNDARIKQLLDTDLMQRRTKENRKYFSLSGCATNGIFQLVDRQLLAIQEFFQ